MLSGILNEMCIRDRYRDKYYVIGESHLVYQGNKTETDDFYILTLAGLAEEMKYRGLHEADVVLAVGLPLAWVKTQAAEWRNYLMREKELDFSFRKERYKVHLCGLEIFPQGLAAVHNQGSMPGMNMLVDIGNGTMSILEIHDGRPMENSISTEVFGVQDVYKRQPINAITAPMIRKWQGEMIDKGFKPTYLKTINNQLSSILNYAVRFYELRSNPCHKAGSMGTVSYTHLEYLYVQG